MQLSDKMSYTIKKDPIGLYVQTDEVTLRPPLNLKSASRLSAGDEVQLIKGSIPGSYLISKKTDTGVYEELWQRILKPGLKRGM